MHAAPLPFLPVMLVPLFFMAFFVVVFAFSIALTAFWIWMIVDCVQNEPSTGNDKIVWLLILIFTHGIGALIYLFARKLPRGRMIAQQPPPPGV